MACIVTWYQAALKSIATVAKITEPKSLYPQDILPTIKTDLFAVNQMVATWDAQCAYEGQPSGNILQVACSERGNYFKAQYTCVQYQNNDFKEYYLNACMLSGTKIRARFDGWTFTKKQWP